MNSSGGGSEIRDSVISVIQRMDQRKLPEKSLISDPPSGLLRLLRKKFSNLSNPEGGSEIRDFSGSFSDPPSGLLRLLNFFQ